MHRLEALRPAIQQAQTLSRFNDVHKQMGRFLESVEMVAAGRVRLETKVSGKEIAFVTAAFGTLFNNAINLLSILQQMKQDEAKAGSDRAVGHASPEALFIPGESLTLDQVSKILNSLAILKSGFENSDIKAKYETWEDIHYDPNRANGNVKS